MDILAKSILKEGAPLKWARFFTLLALATALAGVAGWWTGTQSLVTIFPTWYAMTFRSASMTSLFSLAFLLFTCRSRWSLVIWSFCLFVSFSILINRFIYPLGVEDFFRWLSGPKLKYLPSDTSPDTALSYFILLIALGFYFLPRLNPWLIWLSGILSLGVATFTVSVLFSYLAGLKTTEGNLTLVGMSFQSAFALFMLSLALIFTTYSFVDTLPKKGVYYVSFIVFVIFSSLILVVYRTWNQQVKRNIVEILEAESGQALRVELTKLKKVKIILERFVSRLNLGEGKWDHGAQIDAESYVHDLTGIKAIVVRSKDYTTYSRMKEGIPRELREEFLNFKPQNFVTGYNLHAFNDEIYLIYYAPLSVSSGEEVLVYFNATEYFFVDPGDEDAKGEEFIIIKVNDFPVSHSNFSKKEESVLKASSEKVFENLKVQVIAEAGASFIRKLEGVFGPYFLLPAISMACAVAALAFILQRYKILAEDLKAANQTKSNFLSNVSHEIRTPLHGIIGSGSLLEVSDLNQDQQKRLETLMFSARYMLDLVNNLLDITRVESKSYALDYQPLVIKPLAEKLIASMDPLIQKKGLHVNLYFQSDTDKLPILPLNGVKQVLTNLVGNAIKYTDHGSIELKIEVKKIGEVNFSVKDTGIGIPQEKQDLLFNKFYRVDEQDAIKKGGTGLGLFLTKTLVTEMKGKITFESQYKQGTTFYVTLPVKFK